jgi:hypothetical protein
VRLDPNHKGLLVYESASYITNEIVTAFQKLWTNNKTATFSAVFKVADKALHLSLPSYPNRAACAKAELINTSSVMGTNGNKQCVYWARDPDYKTQWECLNDGTCATTLRTLGTYSTETECVNNCGKRWTCMQSKDNGANYAGPNGKVCVQDPLGPCIDLPACEKACHGYTPTPPPTPKPS